MGSRLLWFIAVGVLVFLFSCHTGKRKGDAPASFQPTLYTYLKLVKEKNWTRAALFWEETARPIFKERIESLPRNVLFASLQPVDVLKVQNRTNELIVVIRVERYTEDSITLVREVWQQRWKYDEVNGRWVLVDERTVPKDSLGP